MSTVPGNTTAGSEMPPGYSVHSVSNNIFRRFVGKTKIKYERWSRYLDTTDESQKKIYDDVRKGKTVILRNEEIGSYKLIYGRR